MLLRTWLQLTTFICKRGQLCILLAFFSLLHSAEVLGLETKLTQSCVYARGLGADHTLAVRAAPLAAAAA
jgi:hypothetical protein